MSKQRQSSVSRSKIIISLLLAAAIIPLFGLFVTSTSGQSMTTLTTMQIYTTSQTVSGTSGGKYCFFDYTFSFSAQKGQQITPTIQSSSKIDFYLLTDADYKAWIKGGSKCDLTGISSPLVKQEGITSYDMSISIPNDGVYWYFFINRSPDTDASVSFSYPSPVTVSLTVTGSNSSLGGDTTTIVVAAVAVVAVGLAYFAGTRRGGAPVAGQRRGQAHAAAQSEFRFCSNCGQKIPTSSKFCSSCGATQD